MRDFRGTNILTYEERFWAEDATMEHQRAAKRAATAANFANQRRKQQEKQEYR